MPKLRSLLKPLVFLLCLVPLSLLAFGAVMNTLGGNPVEYMIRALGEWSLRFLLLSLAISPVFKLARWGWLMSLRRMIGLYAFFYLCLHMLLYVGLDLSFDLQALWRDVVKRTFITVGMVAFVLMLPLALTSTAKMVKRLGAGRWKKLHKLVYPTAILAVLHFYWMAKADKSEPLFYAAVLLFLFILRIPAKLRRS